MFSINQMLKMQVDETSEGSVDNFLNPLTGMSIAAQDLANLYGESSASDPSNVEPVRPPDVIDEDELSDESWAKQIQPKLELEEQTNTCRECGLSFKNRASLRRHKATHNDFKPFQCDQCDYSTTMREYLRKHMKFRHKKDLKSPNDNRTSKRLPIPVTSPVLKTGPKFDYTIIKNKNALTTTRSVLASWIVSFDVTGKKNFKCRLCHYVTSRSNHLTQHEQLHTGKKFQCEYCSFSSVYKRSLACHLKQHFKNYKFKCNLCHVGYAREFDLSNHISKVHKIHGNFCLMCKIRLRSILEFTSHVNIHAKTCYVKLRKLSTKDLTDAKATFPSISEISRKLTVKKMSNDKKTFPKTSDTSKKLSWKELSNAEGTNNSILPKKKPPGLEITLLKNCMMSKLEAALTKTLQIEKFTSVTSKLDETVAKSLEVKKPISTYAKHKSGLLKPPPPITKLPRLVPLVKKTEVTEPIAQLKPSSVTKPIPKSTTMSQKPGPSNELVEDDLYLIVEEEDVPRGPEVIEEIDLTDSDTDDNAKRTPTVKQPIVISLPMKSVNVRGTMIPKQTFPSISSVSGNFPFYSCNACHFSSQSETLLQRHASTHIVGGENLKRHQCEICPLSFNRRTHLIRHQQGHLGVKNFKCGYCDQAFVRKDGMQKHMSHCTASKFLTKQDTTFNYFIR